MSTSKPSGSSGRIDSMRNACSSSGASCDMRASSSIWAKYGAAQDLVRPVLGDVERAQRARRARASCGGARKYDGERCSIVTCAAFLRDRRDQRRGRRAGADDDDALAGEVEVLGPLLRVHDRPWNRSMPSHCGW